MLLCAFLKGFYALGPDFSRFGHKDISCRVRNRILDKIVFRQSHVGFFTFFSACFFDIISSMSPQVLAKYFLALIFGCTSKSHVFKKICIHLV